MSDSNPIKNASLFFSGGILAGLTSLTVAAFFYPIFLLGSSASLFVLVSLEELIKIIVLWFLYNFLKLPQKIFYSYSLIFGIGFGLLEILLIYFKYSTISLEAFSPLIIHVITSFFLALGIVIAQRKKAVLISVIFFLIAIGIHFAYNMQIASL